MTVRLECIVLVKSEKPIDTGLLKGASDWMQLFVGTDDSRVIEAGLNCVFKNYPAVCRELD
ncbi:hypothetical protein QIS74_06598 [Colletotrichum tabaci]|uniref:Uncharacterized protein n=1 Tax=Colletotrichum tabaci TaxID=1209068 RepID=A0AAV9TE32_9PEZI